MKKHKKLWIAAATATLAASIAMGTFAWQSISQRIINESVADKNPGGRIHDDFNGEKKAVYAENFTTEEDGLAIYVRIRLNEYMEMGEDAGINREKTQRNVKVLGQYLEGEADINDVSTWRVHKPDTEEDADPFHTYWSWNMGGQTIYMPTFNKNKDSLAVDVNGTYAGKDGVFETGTPYDDYYPYELGESKTTTAYYDYDTDNDYDEGKGTGLGNGGTLNTNYYEVEEKHVAAYTSDATIQRMSEWIKDCIPGNYWVWDSDGWYYWALPLNPGETTGCLLNSIQQIQYGEKSYYAIEVVGQFATSGDWGDPDAGTGFYADGNEISTDAMTLLNTIQKLITGADGEFYVYCGSNTYQRVEENGSLSELLCAGKDLKIGTGDDQMVIVLDTALEIGDNTYGTLFLKDETSENVYYAVGSDGNLGTSDDIKLWYSGTAPFPEETDKISTKGADTVQLQVTAASSTKGHTAKVDTTAKTITIQPYDVVNFETAVTLNETVISNQKVTWKVSSVDDTAISFNASGINTGKLTVGATPQIGTTFTIYAVSEEDSSVKSDTYKVTVEGPMSVVISQNGKEVTSVFSASKTSATSFTATVKAADGSNYAIQDVTWSMSGELEQGTILSTSGALTIALAEDTETELLITATSTYAQTVFETITVKPTSIFKGIAIGSTTTVTIDNTAFYVLAYDATKDQYLIFAKEPVASSIFDSMSYQWNTACEAYIALQKWLSQQATLKDKAQQTTISTRSAPTSSSYITASCEIFLLSEADLYGTADGTVTRNSSEYTYKNTQLTTNDTIRGFTVDCGEYSADNYWYWLRSTYSSANGKTQVAGVNKEGELNSSPNYTIRGFALRPALWVKGL